MPEGKKIEIKPAKGRPMLTWVGKRPLSYVTAFPAQHVETFAPSHSELGTPNSALWAEWPTSYPKGGLLFHGDNKEVLAHLLANGFRGKVHPVRESCSLMADDGGFRRRALGNYRYRRDNPDAFSNGVDLIYIDRFYVRENDC